MARPNSKTVTTFGEVLHSAKYGYLMNNFAGRLQKHRRVCLHERIRTLEKIVIRELKLLLSSKWLYINKERCIVFARFFFYSKS